MKLKALENIRAARTLTELTRPCPNAAASRAYYAAYLACWFRLSEDGHPVPLHGARRYWRHDTFPNEILKAGIVDEEGSEVVDYLYSQRVIADYYPDDIGPAEARDLTQLAIDFLGALGVTELSK